MGEKRISNILLNGNIYEPEDESSRILRKTIFKDKILLKKYLIALKKISQKSYLDDLLNSLSDSLDMALSQIYSSMPYYYYDPLILYKNQEVIRKIIDPPKTDPCSFVWERE